MAQQVCDLYQEGRGLREVSEIVGKSGAWVRDVLVLNGVTIKGRGRPPKGSRPE